jgi:hypothetical protein
MNSDANIDMAMMIYLERSLYNEELSFDQANCMFYGMLAIFPGLSSKIPVAARAIQAWRRQHIAGEGVPIPVEAMLLVAECFRKEGSGVLGLLVELIFDCYLRAGDWAKLRKEDCFVSDGKLALILGSAERGEKAKTGYNQGVVIDSTIVADELRARVETLASGEFIFPCSADVFRKEWSRAAKSCSLEWIGPPHDLRHGGASRDVEEKSRTLEEVRRRGRWKSLESVQRYTKTWLLVRERSKMSTPMLAEARKLLLARGERIVGAPPVSLLAHE